MSKLNELTVTEALEGLKKKEFTSVDLVKACLSQIEKFDPKIKAFLRVTSESALKKAEEADKEISAKGAKAFVNKPLLGISYAAKDNYSTKNIETTASSKVL